MKLFPLASHRKWLLGIVAIAGGGLFALYLLLYKILSGLYVWCADKDVVCMQNMESLDAFYSGLFLKSIIVVAFLLLFFPERAFKWWRWFALVAIPFLGWWIFAQEGGFFGVFDQLAASKVSGYFFFVASFLIAISASFYNYLKLPNKK
jgi:hypothetical protein